MIAGPLIIVLLLGAPPSPEAIGQARQEVLSDSSYQTTWPGEAPAPRRRFTRSDPGTQGNQETRWEPNEDRQFGTRDGDGPAGSRWRQNNRSRSSSSNSDGTGLLQAVVWIAAAAVLFLLLLSFARAWRRTPPDIVAKPKAPTPTPAPRAALARPLTEAERLAAEGRYAEAVHVLLLETLGALRAHTEGGLAQSLTSREVVQQVSMPESAREAMGELVRTVERSLFGNRPVTKLEYEQCAAAFASFRKAYEGAAR